MATPGSDDGRRLQMSGGTQDDGSVRTGGSGGGTGPSQGHPPQGKPKNPKAPPKTAKPLPNTKASKGA